MEKDIFTWSEYRRKNPQMGYKELFLRRMAFYVFNNIKKTRISAEFLTSFRIIFSIILVSSVIFFESWALILSLICLQIVLWLDYIDGLIARYNGRYQKRWVYVDTVTHYII